jgi:hypothetical protein
MLFPPQLEEQLRVHDRKPIPAVNRDVAGDVAAPAEGDVQREPVQPRRPMVYDQPLGRPTQLTTAVPLEDAFPLPGKKAE